MAMKTRERCGDFEYEVVVGPSLPPDPTGTGLSVALASWWIVALSSPSPSATRADSPPPTDPPPPSGGGAAADPTDSDAARGGSDDADADEEGREALSRSLTVRRFAVTQRGDEVKTLDSRVAVFAPEESYKFAFVSPGLATLPPLRRVSPYAAAAVRVAAKARVTIFAEHPAAFGGEATTGAYDVWRYALSP